jgi:Uma2 family endonuclease
MKMGLPAIKKDMVYTYGDYLSWPDDERWELIDGVAYNMCAAPNRFHQGILMGLGVQVGNFLPGKPCKAYMAPFDVIFPDSPDQEENEVTTVVQPDLSVICDPKKLTYKGCTGAPDWVVEILSPYTSKKDFREKLALYERHGVKEYWIVDPGNRYVHVYLRDEKTGKYPEDPAVYLAEARVPCRVLDGLVVDLAKIFED